MGRRPNSAECGPAFPWDVFQRGWNVLDPRHGFPLLLIIRFPPHAVTVIVAAKGRSATDLPKKTQKDYKVRESVKSGTCSSGRLRPGLRAWRAMTTVDAGRW